MTKQIMGALTLCALLSACGEKDYYDANFEEAKTRSEYAANFIALYGEDVLKQSWDLSAFRPNYSTRSTRAGFGFETSTNYVTIDRTVIDEFLKEIPEGKDNTAKGSAFVMTVPNNPFTIVPQYANAGYTWDLYMVVGNGPDAMVQKIWGRGDNMQRKHKVDATHWYPQWEALKTNNTTDTNYEYQAKSYTFNTKKNPLPVGEVMYFYLDVKNTEYKATSLEGQMLTLNVKSKPSCIPSNDYEYKIIGCEDKSIANDNSCDKDINDFIFLIYGAPELPKEIRIEEGEPLVNTKAKRYMIEDLGSTDDFDFNDIVVDVQQSRKETPIMVNGAFDHWENGEWEQKAIIRHLGGTLPFQLKIGDTTLEPMQGQLDKDVEVTAPIKGWNPDTNNILVAVQHKVNEDVKVMEIGFPKTGEVPLIIATDVTTQWMKERENIPESWWKK